MNAPKAMMLSLITPYRNAGGSPKGDRHRQLQIQLAWWRQYPSQLRQGLDWILVEVTAEPSPGLAQMLQQQQVRYLHLPCSGPFPKTQALNLGLAQARGDLIAAFDVDLIPLGQTLERHRWLAGRSPQFLVTGYRLMAMPGAVALTTISSATLNSATLNSTGLDSAALDPAVLGQAMAQASLGPEDQPSALRKHLLGGERFGVMPLFWRDRLQTLGGWDEAFVGWGAEDQALIEHYLTPQQALCRCPELIYLHLHHGPAAGWNEPDLTQKNRDYYYRRNHKT